MPHIGVVMEGSHDYFMLEPLVAKELQLLGHENITFQRLQPTQDATGNYPEGGWTRVVAWCLDNAADNFESALTSVLNGQPDLDGLLIHLDGDAAEHLASYASTPLPQTLTATSRVNYITAAIEEWLDVPDLYRPRIIIAVPVLHTEAWMNAALNFCTPPFEENQAKDIFRSKRDRAISRKLADHYRSQGIKSAQHVDLIYEQCKSYQILRDEIRKCAFTY